MTTGETEVPLVLGYMYGARPWVYDRGGFLRGLFKPHRWLPGPNEATCWANVGIRGSYWPPGRFATPPTTAHEPEPIRRDGHNMLACQCGFYAYNEDSSDYRKPSPVTGVVRMSGRVCVGQRGARGERAEIVALYFSTPNDGVGGESWLRTLVPGSEGFLSRRQRAIITRRYGVPVFDDFDDMVSRFPVNLPKPKEAS